VKRFSADGSVGFPHVRVGHRQALKSKRLIRWMGLFNLGYDEIMLTTGCM
jgi:hypothetical protein